MNILSVGVQSKGIVYDNNPLEGFDMMKRAGFSCCDFSLDSYFTDLSFSSPETNVFFRKSVQELKDFFAPHKEAAEIAGIKINQMCMQYPVCIPNMAMEIAEYLMHTVASKSMEICAFFGCSYLVMSGFDASWGIGRDEVAWEWTEKLIESLAPMAKELEIAMCIENSCKDSCCDVEKLLMYIDCMNERYNAEILGFCFNTGHAKLSGIDFEDMITKLGNRLKVFHIHDNDGNRNLHQIPFTLAGDGQNVLPTDWEGFIRGLRRIHFDKVLSFETASVLSSFPEKMKQDVLRLVAQIGDYFMGEIRDS